MTGAYWVKSFVIFPLDCRGDSHSMTAVAVFLSFGARVRGGCGLKLLSSCLVRALLFESAARYRGRVAIDDEA